MARRFDEEMKELMKRFNKIFKEIMKPPRGEKIKSNDSSKSFEKKGPGFHLKVEMVSLKGPEEFKGKLSPENQGKEAGVVEEDENDPRKLALKRFEEKNEEE